MSDLLPPSLQEKIACLKRELAMRRSAYPRWIAAGKMKADRAERELVVMEAILKDYDDKQYERKGNAS